MKHTPIAALLIALLLLLGGCGAQTEDPEPTGEPDEITTSRIESSREEPSAPEPPEPEPDTPAMGPEEGSETAETPPAAGNPESVTQAGGVKPLIAPLFDPFPLQYPFVTAQVGVEQIVEIRFTATAPDWTETTVTLRERADIERVFNLMNDTELTAEDASTTPPDMGGSFEVIFVFDDNTTATVSMGTLVWLNDSGPFLFTDPASERLYTGIYDEFGRA